MAAAHTAAVAAVIISGRASLQRSDACSLVLRPLISTGLMPAIGSQGYRLPALGLIVSILQTGRCAQASQHVGLHLASHPWQRAHGLRPLRQGPALLRLWLLRRLESAEISLQNVAGSLEKH